LILRILQAQKTKQKVLIIEILIDQGEPGILRKSKPRRTWDTKDTLNPGELEIIRIL